MPIREFQSIREFLLGLLLYDESKKAAPSKKAKANALRYINALTEPGNDANRILCNKRHFLIDTSMVKRLTSSEGDVYQLCAVAKQHFFSRDHNEALKVINQTHLDLLGMPRSGGWPFIGVVIADAFMMISRFNVASFLLLDSLTACGPTGDAALRATALSFMGDIALQKNLLSVAELRYHESQRIWHTLSDYHRYAIGLADIARIRYLQGDFVGSFSMIQEATASALESEKLDTVGYCLLTEIELYTRLRDSAEAQRAFDKYKQDIAPKSLWAGSIYEKLIFATYYFERMNFKEGLIELLSAGLMQFPLKIHELQPETMVKMATYLNFEGRYDAALSVLLECREVTPLLESSRHALFLRWLDVLVVSLRGHKEFSLADRVSDLIFRCAESRLTGTENSALNSSRWSQTFTALEEAMNDIRGLKPDMVNLYGLRINLNDGTIYKEYELHPAAQLKGNPLIVFRLFAHNQGTCFNNREIIRSYDKSIADLEEPPRRDNYYIPYLQKLFVKLCGERIIENRRGYGYWIPKR